MLAVNLSRSNRSIRSRKLSERLEPPEPFTNLVQLANVWVNLHWHDLRHEYASRLVEGLVPLAQVRDLLGHASILTTERYDNQRLEALQAAGPPTFVPVSRFECFGLSLRPEADAAAHSRSSSFLRTSSQGIEDSGR